MNPHVQTNNKFIFYRWIFAACTYNWSSVITIQLPSSTLCSPLRVRAFSEFVVALTCLKGLCVNFVHRNVLHNLLCSFIRNAKHNQSPQPLSHCVPQNSKNLELNENSAAATGIVTNSRKASHTRVRSSSVNVEITTGGGALNEWLINVATAGGFLFVCLF